MIEVKIVLKRQKSLYREREREREREKVLCALHVQSHVPYKRHVGRTTEVLWNYTNQAQMSGHRTQPHSGHLQPWGTPLRYADWSSTAPASVFEQNHIKKRDI